MRKSQTQGKLRRSQEADSALRAMLEDLRLGELREIVRRRSWPVKASAKSDYASAIATLLTDQTEVARAVIALPQSMRSALQAAFVAEEGNGITPAVLARVLTALCINNRETFKPVEAAALLQDLARWGLVIPWRGFSNGPRHLFPSEVQKLVPPLPGWCAASDLPPSGLVSSRDPGQFVRVLMEVWKRIAQESPEVRKRQGTQTEPAAPIALANRAHDSNETERSLEQQRLPATHPLPMQQMPLPGFLLQDEALQALVSVTNGDAEELEFACRLLCELDLVKSDGERLRVQNAAMDGFLERSAGQLQARVVQAYLSLQEWSELDMLLRADRALVLQCDPRFARPYGQLRAQLLALRHVILRLLATAGDEVWCAVADIDPALRNLWPIFFPVPLALEEDWPSRVSGLAWRLTQGETDEPRDQGEDWRKAQGAFLRLLMGGPLYWLGLASLSLRNGQLSGARLHGLADLLWNREVPGSSDEQPARPVMIDEEEWTIAVRPRGVRPEIHPFLASIARLEEASPARYVFRLDMRATYATFREKPIQDVVADWQRIVPVPLPQPVHDALHDWWKAYGEVHLYEELALLEVTDDLTLQELLASTSLARHVLARLSPRIVVLRDNAADALMAELAAKGYLPQQIR